MTIAVGSDHEIITDNPYRVFTSAEEDTAKMVYRVQASAGQPIKVIKTVAYHTSRGVPTRELVDRCRRTLDRTVEYGIEAEFAAQRSWLDAYWERSDVSSTASRRCSRPCAGTCSRWPRRRPGPSSPAYPPRG